MKTKWSKIIHPLEKQKEAFKALKYYKYILYGGAMGGGKSYWLRWALAVLLKRFYDKYKKIGVRGGLFCEDYPSLKDRHLSKIEYEFPKWLGILNKSRNEFILDRKWGKGVICFRNLDDPSKYQSAEFAVIAIDELTKNNKKVFDFLRTRLRWPGIPAKEWKFIAGTNPGGIGHSWVKKLWIDKIFEPTEKEKDLFYFIPAKAIDNKYLDESYYNALKGLPPEMQKAYLEGDWNLFKGQYFTEWRNDKHVTPAFPIPETWKKFRAYDHGRENPCCCKWYALDGEGRVWVYREFYQAGLNVDQIANEINRLSGNEEYEWSIADPSIFAKTGMVDKSGGQTIAETFFKNGIVFLPASSRRIDGWNLMHQYLFWSETQPPKLIYFNTCYNSIRTIPALIHSEIRPEDIETKSEDHCADCDRYFLMGLHEAKTQIPLTETEKKLQRMQEVKTDLTKLYTGEYYREGLTNQ